MPFNSSLCGSGCQVTGTASFTLVDKSTGEVSYKTAGPNATLTISSTGQVRAQVTTPGGDLYAGPKAVGNASLSFSQLGPESISGSLDTSAATCNWGSGSYYYWDSSDINTPVYYFQTGNLNLSYTDNKVIYHSNGISSKDMGQWIAPWDASCRSGSSYGNKLIIDGTIDITVTLPPRPTPTPTPTPSPTSTPPPPAELTLNVTPDLISPANDDGNFEFSDFKVHSTTGLGWILTVVGNKPGPEDENGLPTVGEPCTWEKRGSGDQTIPFEGKCSDGENQTDGTYMVDGSYVAKVVSGNLQDTEPIKIDNTGPIIGDITLTTNANGGYDAKINFDDPIVNGVAAGIDRSAGAKIPSILSINGKEFKIENVSIFDNEGNFGLANVLADKFALLFAIKPTSGSSTSEELDELLREADKLPALDKIKNESKIQPKNQCVVQPKLYPNCPAYQPLSQPIYNVSVQPSPGPTSSPGIMFVPSSFKQLLSNSPQQVYLGLVMAADFDPSDPNLTFGFLTEGIQYDKDRIQKDYLNEYSKLSDAGKVTPEVISGGISFDDGSSQALSNLQISRFQSCKFNKNNLTQGLGKDAAYINQPYPPSNYSSNFINQNAVGRLEYRRTSGQKGSHPRQYTPRLITSSVNLHEAYNQIVCQNKPGKVTLTFNFGPLGTVSFSLGWDYQNRTWKVYER